MRHAQATCTVHDSCRAIGCKALDRAVMTVIARARTVAIRRSETLSGEERHGRMHKSLSAMARQRMMGRNRNCKRGNERFSFSFYYLQNRFHSKPIMAGSAEKKENRREKEEDDGNDNDDEEEEEEEEEDEEEEWEREREREREKRRETELGCKERLSE